MNEPRSTLIQPSTVRLGGKIELIFKNDNLPDERGLKVGVSGGWVVHTGILADLLNGVKPRPFWASHDRVAKEYEAAI